MVAAEVTGVTAATALPERLESRAETVAPEGKLAAAVPRA